ncbi:hypothetical protein SYNTR_0736 [Candidatus Syntrophocurvum alkaliphilum]|uniref:Uncharacterized protein n=1 Tax=Candidatus Syntrophocurvum alkaliphilum TaxID=2293317 RepID=A0A6I6DAB0_9FIRM|nr:hypothetical protein [Candidatus Syntrophocurvum alkaliphilum]QGT99329.1 hypothetical protein SYNTR_0736 [Candidatus Syntrophocurvum alkaliphilum]
MMNLGIYYKKNKIGNKIYDKLSESISAIEYQEFKIKNQIYLNIQLKKEGSNLKRVLNTPKAIVNTISRDTLSEILQHNNVAQIKGRESINRTYEILIFDLSVISIRQITHTRNKKTVKYASKKDAKKAVEIALRALYLTGLDFGMVKVVFTSRHAYKIRTINPSPIIRERDFSLFIKKIKRLYDNEGTAKNANIKMGADPEFMLINANSGRLIAASKYFPREGTVGCDSIRIPNRQQRPIAEIRPAPEESPLELLDNIKKALNNANKMAPYKNVKWIAGSLPVSGYPIGGHIHFSKIKSNYSILRALDNYICIPIFLIENPRTATIRRKKYGFLFDYREKDYGGFEYRTPGSWLVSQEVATAILCLAKVVASHYYELRRNFFLNVEAHKAFYSGNQNYFKPIFRKLWSDIEQTSSYIFYEKELKTLYTMIFNNDLWNEKDDLRKAWEVSWNNKKSSSNKNKSRKTSTTSTRSNSSRNTRRRPRSVTTRTNSRSTNRSSNTGNTNSSQNQEQNNRNRSTVTQGRITVSGPTIHTQPLRFY